MVPTVLVSAVLAHRLFERSRRCKDEGLMRSSPCPPDVAIECRGTLRSRRKSCLSSRTGVLLKRAATHRMRRAARANPERAPLCIQAVPRQREKCQNRCEPLLEAQPPYSPCSLDAPSSCTCLPFRPRSPLEAPGQQALSWGLDESRPAQRENRDFPRRV